MVNERFEWDDGKAADNELKHGVAFELAEEAFDDPLSITIPDPLHSDGEQRYLLIGETMFKEVLVVAHAERGDRIRIFSARYATRLERRRYMSKDYDEINDKDDLQPEYDFSGGVRGKYHQPGKTIIRMTIDEDVARHFWSSKLVNDALRQLIAEGRAPEPRNE